MARNFKDLSEKEILALAITLEEEDGRIYSDFADGLRGTFPATGKMFDEMQAEESEHRRSLIEIFRQRFGEHIPLIRRQDVKGFVERRPEPRLRLLPGHPPFPQALADPSPAEAVVGEAAAGEALGVGPVVEPPPLSQAGGGGLALPRVGGPPPTHFLWGGGRG